MRCAWVLGFQTTSRRWQMGLVDAARPSPALGHSADGPWVAENPAVRFLVRVFEGKSFFRTTPACVCGLEKGRGRRIYIQDVEDGSVRAIPPENVQTTGLSTTDGRYVVDGPPTDSFDTPSTTVPRFPCPSCQPATCPCSGVGTDVSLTCGEPRPGRLRSIGLISRPVVASCGRRYNLRTPVGVETYIIRIVITPRRKRPTATTTCASSRNCSSWRV